MGLAEPLPNTSARHFDDRPNQKGQRTRRAGNSSRGGGHSSEFGGDRRSGGRERPSNRGGRGGARGRGGYRGRFPDEQSGDGESSFPRFEHPPRKTAEGASPHNTVKPTENGGVSENRESAHFVAKGASTSAKKPNGSRLKVSVRYLPPMLTEAEFVKAVPCHLRSLIVWGRFYNGTEKPDKKDPARALVQFSSTKAVHDFSREFNGHRFVDANGADWAAQVEWAQFQRGARLTGDGDKVRALERKSDPYENTYLQHNHFLNFLETLENEKDKPAGGQSILNSEMDADTQVSAANSALVLSLLKRQKSKSKSAGKKTKKEKSSKKERSRKERKSTKEKKERKERNGESKRPREKKPRKQRENVENGSSKEESRSRSERRRPRNENSRDAAGKITSSRSGSRQSDSAARKQFPGSNGAVPVVLSKKPQHTFSASSNSAPVFKPKIAQRPSQPASRLNANAKEFHVRPT